MKPPYNRALFFKVSLAFLIAVFTACGGRGGEEEAGAAEEPAQEEPVQQPAQQPEEGTEELPTPAGEETPAPQQVQPAVVHDVEAGTGGDYTIQLSSWRTEEKARREALIYQELGLEAYVQRAEIPDMGTWYRVRIGIYTSLEEAREAAGSLVGIPPDLSWVDNYREREPPPH